MRSSLLLAAYLFVLLCCCGCGDGRKPTYEVHGQVVSVDDAPAAKALVTFHPVGDPSPEAVHPTGTVDEAGRFTLTSFKTGDGAPAGEYQPTVVWFLAVPSATVPREYETRNLLPELYAQPATSPLPRVTVTKGKNELPPFKLSLR